MTTPECTTPAQDTTLGRDTTPDALARRLLATRGRRATLEECRADVECALDLIAAPGPSFIRAVRIAGITVARP